MEARASVKYVRIAPRKMRTVVDLVRGKDVAVAQGILAGNPKMNISRILVKLLNQAVANATENARLDVDALYIKQITVDGGPSLKRFLPRMRGRADRILKRTSVVNLVLDERAKKVKAAAKGEGKKATGAKKNKPKAEASKAKG